MEKVNIEVATLATQSADDEPLQEVRTGRIQVEAKLNVRESTVSISLLHSDGITPQDVYDSRKAELEGLLPKLEKVPGAERVIEEVKKKINDAGPHDKLDGDTGYISEKALVEVQTIVKMHQIMSRRVDSAADFVKTTWEGEKQNIEKVVVNQKLEDFRKVLMENLKKKIDDGKVIIQSSDEKEPNE